MLMQVHEQDSDLQLFVPTGWKKASAFLNPLLVLQVFMLECATVSTLNLFANVAESDSNSFTMKGKLPHTVVIFLVFFSTIEIY